MHRIFVIFFLTLWIDGFAQFDKLGINTFWHRGSISLANGEQLDGYIQNNEKLHLIRYKPDASSDEGGKLINEQDIVLMEYYDSQIEVKRRFASLNYKAKDLPESLAGKKKSFDIKDEYKEGAALFEILIEYKQFAALSRVTEVDVALRKKRVDIFNTFDPSDDWEVSKKVGFEYFEEFYFFNDDGMLAPVLILNYLEKNKDNFLHKNDKNYKPNLNRSVVKRHMIQYWERIENYLDENDLNIKMRADFLKLLEYYKQLESQ